MEAERTKILEMLQQGQITVEQADRLLEALEQAQQAETRSAPAPEPEPPPQHFRGPFPPGTDWRAWGRGLAEQVKSEVQRAVSGLTGVGGGLGPGGRSNFSTATVTPEYLQEMKDGSHFTNYGVLNVSEAVPEDLLKAKVARFTNFGTVQGPEALLKVLEDRCHTNFGSFGGAPRGDLLRPSRPAAPPPPPQHAPVPMEQVEITGWELGGWQQWEYQGQYRELAIRCHGGNLVLEGTDEDRLELSVGQPVKHGEPLPEGWAGGLRLAPRQEDARLIFEIGNPSDPSETQELTFRFAVPGGLKVAAETAVGDITAKDLPGSVDLRTGGGNIRCTDIAGEAVVNSAGGELSLTDIAGPVRADTAGGNIRVTDVAGDAQVQTAGGEIQVRDIAGGLSMISGGGNLEVNDVAGTVSASTGGGNIRVHDIAGNVSADTGGGDVLANDVSGNVTGGTGAGNVNVSDVSGNVDVHTGAGDISLHDISGSVSAKTGAGNLSLSDIDGDATIETGFGQVSLRDISGRVEQRGG